MRSGVGAHLDLGYLRCRMSAVDYVQGAVIPAAMWLLPEKMDTQEARAELLAIGLQESRFEHRKQIGGPAHGFAQFELRGGVRGVLTHAATRPVILPILEELQYEPVAQDCYEAIVHNDILAMVFARLLLWTLPGPLPRRDDPEGAWDQYIAAWRPGKPHRDTWDAFYDQAWALVA
jgi:hypothetical protein